MSFTIKGSQQNTYIYCGDQWATSNQLYDSRFDILLSIIIRRLIYVQLYLAPGRYQRRYRILQNRMARSVFCGRRNGDCYLSARHDLRG